MALKRLTPVIQRYDLGYVRLWRDELAEIVRLMRDLNGAKVRVEADDYLIEDINSDLPQVGTRLSSFKANATKVTSASSSDIMEVRLSRHGCQIEAIDPDLSAIGAIQAIQQIVGRCERVPRWFTRIFGSNPGARWDKIILYPAATCAALYLISFIAAGIIVDTIKHSSAVPTPIAAAIGVAVGLLFIGMIIGYARARSVIFTGSRAEAPTWWQRHRTDVALHLVFGITFFVLGILTGHH